ncbi:MAG: ankyrin repeat domain-containing protein [Rhizobiaceae bacterium]
MATLQGLMLLAAGIVLAMLSSVSAAQAQTPPSAGEIAGYKGLHLAAHQGDVVTIEQMVKQGGDLEARDGSNRTAVHIAAFARKPEAIAALARAGADMNTLEGGRYDAVTIAAVADDPETLAAALKAGNKPGNVTSVWDGTALIAAAHLGHHRPIDLLIKAGAPLDHVNNLGWTALIEAVVLGDGGENHQKSLKLLLDAGADKSIVDPQGKTPLDLARDRGFDAMVRLLGG